MDKKHIVTISAKHFAPFYIIWKGLQCGVLYIAERKHQMKIKINIEINVMHSFDALLGMTSMVYIHVQGTIVSKIISTKMQNSMLY